MNQQRTVSFKTKFRLANQRPIQLRLCVALVIIPLIYIAATYTSLYRYINNDLPDVDYIKVNENGQPTQGVINNLEFVDFFQPSTIISFTYPTENGNITSKYQTLRSEQFKIGDKIDVKYLNEESIIVGQVPYNFPFIIFFAPVLPFLIIGILFSIYFLITLRKQINLFKHGQVRDAELISLTPRPGFPLPLFGEKVRVFYNYKISGNNKVDGQSDTRDLSITKNKKPGDTIKIFVSPDNEFMTCLIPTADITSNNWKID